MPPRCLNKRIPHNRFRDSVRWSSIQHHQQGTLVLTSYMWLRQCLHRRILHNRSPNFDHWSSIVRLQQGTLVLTSYTWLHQCLHMRNPHSKLQASDHWSNILHRPRDKWLLLKLENLKCKTNFYISQSQRNITDQLPFPGGSRRERRQR